MSLVLWATTIGSVAGPCSRRPATRSGIALGLPPLVGPFLFSAVAFAALDPARGHAAAAAEGGLDGDGCREQRSRCRRDAGR